MMKRILISTAAVLLSGAAFAADAIVAPDLPPVVDLKPAFDWTGGFVGLHGGYSWADSTAGYDDPTFALFGGPLSMKPSGGFGGIQAGYNYQASTKLVVGFDASLSYADINDSIPDLITPGATIESNTDFVGTLRARTGYAAGQFLPFVSGGMAFARSEAYSTDLGRGDTKTQVGWTAGAGLEVAVNERWSVVGEYMYTDLGKETWFEGEAFSSTSDTTSNAARFGVNMRF